MDLQAAGRLPDEIDPTEVVHALRSRYEQLWDELTREQQLGVTERHLIDARLNRLNELGFDVTEISIIASPDGSTVTFQPVVVEAGHHARELTRLTGLAALENQARRLLNDMRSYGAWLCAQSGVELPEAVVAARWLIEVFEPALANIPDDLRNRREPAELFHEILLHRDALVAARHEPLRVPQAASSYAAVALPFAETEQAVVDGGD